MKNQADYSKYKCPFSHIEKECGHELKGPENYDTHSIWCACGFHAPVFCLDPDKLGLEKIKEEPKKRMTTASELIDAGALFFWRGNVRYTVLLLRSNNGKDEAYLAGPSDGMTYSFNLVADNYDSWSTALEPNVKRSFLVEGE